MKPNVRLKGSSIKATLTSQRVLDSLTKARNQRQKTFESDRRARSLDRMSTQGDNGSSSRGNSPEGGNNNGGGGSSGYQTRSKTKTNSPFVTSNRFDPLGDDDTGDRVQVEQKKNAPRVRIPPIYIMGKSVADVVFLLKGNGIPQGDDYLLKNTKSSIQFLTKSKELFAKMTSLLKSSDVHFFTHDTSENVPSKFVLSGLPAVNIPDLKEELEALNIVPLDIKVLSSKKSGADEHTFYLVYFKRGTVKILDLRKTKALSNVMVHWRHFSRLPNDAAQCHRCQQFGHGSSNCNLPPKCVKCGGKHLTDVCALPRKTELNNNNNSKSQLKCANCGGSHTANFRGCPSRKAYLEELEKKKKKPARSAPPTKAPAAARTSGTGTSSKGQGRPGDNSSRPQPAPTGYQSYANVAASNGTSVPRNDFGGEGLFTATEFLCLAREMFSRLVGCHTKQQQFDALAELMVKYLYNG